MNVNRFFKSFESKERNTTIISSDVMIANTKRFVPWQIYQHNNHGINIQGTTPLQKIIGDKRISTYSCGCEFEEGLKNYSWSGHWCQLHARQVDTVVEPIKQNAGGFVSGNYKDG